MTGRQANEDVSADINNIISRHLEASTKQAAKISPSYARLWRSLSDLMLAGGKRLRPKLTVLSYQSFCGKDSSLILPIAVAQEFLHFALLIHDDIIDRDYFRYGTDNIAGQYNKYYSQHLSSTEDRAHYAQSSAVLAGDLMISSAYQLISYSEVSDKDKLAAHHILNQALFEAAGGELLDTEQSFMPQKSIDALGVARYKTASYSFIAPLVTGATLANASPKEIRILTDLADSIGIAYQLTDDLLGLFGDEKATGKSTISDITEGKRTFIVETALKTLSPSDTKEFMAIFGNRNALVPQIDSAKQLLLSSGAKAIAEEKVSELATAASRSLAKLNLDKYHHQQFEDIITTATNRVS